MFCIQLYRNTVFRQSKFTFQNVILQYWHQHRHHNCFSSIKTYLKSLNELQLSNSVVRNSLKLCLLDSSPFFFTLVRLQAFSSSTFCRSPICVAVKTKTQAIYITKALYIFILFDHNLLYRGQFCILFTFYFTVKRRIFPMSRISLRHKFCLRWR